MGYGNKFRAILALAVISTSVLAFTQAPPPPPPAGGHPPMPAPQNLKVLPKDIPTADLFKIMGHFNAELGVQCGYCHAGDAATHRLNFASDDKPEKAAARIMLTMTNELNTKYVSTIPGSSGAKVDCGTCHRGHAMPEEFTPAPPAPPAPPASH